MAKEFMSFDELVALLESRGVEIDDNSRNRLMQESYYAVVNGYKAPFLDTAAMESSPEDVYLPGTKFSSIYALFSFDRELRATTFKYLAKAEAMMRTAVVHSFCEAHQGPTDDLYEQSYARPEDMLVAKDHRGNKARLYRKNMTDLTTTLQSKSHSWKPYIAHYANTYGFVPLWVMSNDLTFGNVMHLYQLQKRSEQNKACKIIYEAIGNDRYPFARLTPQKLLRAFSVLVGFRNICAHDERLYCAKVGKHKENDFGAMAAELARILSRSETESFIRDVDRLLHAYQNRFTPLDPGELLTNMGIRNGKIRVVE